MAQQRRPPPPTPRSDSARNAREASVAACRVTAFASPLPSPDGPHAGLTNGGWRLWVRGEDTYLTNRAFGDVWKLSLHGDEAWQFAVTSEHVRAGAQVVPAARERRVWWTFAPPPMEGGGRFAFAVAVPRGVLRRGPLDAGELHIAVEDRWDRLTVARLHMTEPGVDFTPARLVAGPLPLASGRQVWLSARAEECAPAVPSPPPDGAVVEVWSPETHDIAAPGLFLRPMNWG